MTDVQNYLDTGYSLLTSMVLNKNWKLWQACSKSKGGKLHKVVNDDMIFKWRTNWVSRSCSVDGHGNMKFGIDDTRSYSKKEPV
jgi:hypothetical protein